MANRKNFLDAKDSIQVINNNDMEVANMQELNNTITEEHVTMLENKVIELHEEIEQHIENGNTDVANELHQDLVEIEDMIERAHESIQEQLLDEIASDEEDEELLSLYEMKLKIDGAIFYAVKQGAIKYAKMVEKGEETPKFVSSKQIQGIIKNYKLRTGVDMNDKQINFIKTLNPIQIQYIGITLNKARKLATA